MAWKRKRRIGKMGWRRDWTADREGGGAGATGRVRGDRQTAGGKGRETQLGEGSRYSKLVRNGNDTRRNNNKTDLHEMRVKYNG